MLKNAISKRSILANMSDGIMQSISKVAPSLTDHDGISHVKISHQHHTYRCRSSCEKGEVGDSRDHRALDECDAGEW